MAEYILDNSGSRYPNLFSPVAPYTDPKNPYYLSTISTPGLLNTSYPIQQGSFDSRIQSNREARSVYQYYSQTNSTIAGASKKMPFKTFKSHAERLAYIQGMIAAGGQGKPFYSFLGTGGP